MLLPALCGAALELGVARPVSASVIGDDRRVSAVSADYPHASIGSLTDLDSGALCTASVVAADLVLTEAHCALRAPVPADCRWPRPESGCDPQRLVLRDLRFVAGDDHRLSTEQRLQQSLRIVGVVAHGATYRSATPADDGAYFAQRRDDWALLRLSAPLDPARHPPLAIAPPGYAPRNGQALRMPGYSGDRYRADGDPSADTHCQLQPVPLRGAEQLIGHDCDSTAGASGSPLLVADASGRWIVIGLHSDGPDPRHDRHGRLNLGTPASAFWPDCARWVSTTERTAGQPRADTSSR